MRIHQFFDDPVLGFALRLVLALGEDSAADGFAQLVQLAVVAQVLREFVVDLRQLLAADALHGRPEAHGFARHPLRPVILGIGHVEFALFARSDAAQVFGEPG